MHIYDEHIAKHYAAYRPPLHELIVDEVLKDRRFGDGLDVGCGTGYSAIALTNYCDQITGVDHSQSMLDNATKHPKVTYRQGVGEDLPLADCSVDLVTFAGVLYYLNEAKTISELSRVCRGDALIFPYDFEVLLGEFMKLFSLSESVCDDTYDHACNLSRHTGVSTLKRVSRSVDFNATAKEVAHILLSDKTRHAALAEKFKASDPIDRVVEKLDKADAGILKANIHYSLHQLK